MADRGFTGHEHLPSVFGLIDMNGRMYDPVLGRFLSPDPYVQAPDYAQNFNRYAYCYNNPLVYTDPDGEFVVAAFLIGAAISGTVGYFSGKAAGLSGSDLFFYTFANAAIGGISGGAGAAVGAGVAGSLTVGGFAGGAIAGAAGGAAGGFISGTFSTGLNNTMFGTNDNVFLVGLKGAGIGALAGGVIGGTTSGISAYKNGGKFWNGEGVIYDSPLPKGVVETESTGFKYKNNAEIADMIKEGGVDLDAYNTSVDAFGNAEAVSGNGRVRYYRNSEGFINKVSKNGKISTVGGYTIETGINTSQIHMSRIPSDYVFRGTINHELYHAYHISLGLSSRSMGNFQSYTEKLAWDYSHSIGLDLNGQHLRYTIAPHFDIHTPPNLINLFY